MITYHQLITDDFNRIDSSLLGANWTRNGDGDIGIVSNRAQFNSGATGNLHCSYTGASWTGGKDQYAEAKLAVLQSGKDVGPCVRQSGSGSQATVSGYIFDINDSDAAIALGATNFSVALFRVNSGSYNQIGSSVTGLTINANDVIRLEVSGSSLIGRINGVIVITGTDTTITTGNPGLYLGGSGGTSAFDDFAAGAVTTLPCELILQAVSQSGTW